MHRMSIKYLLFTRYNGQAWWVQEMPYRNSYLLWRQQYRSSAWLLEEVRWELKFHKMHQPLSLPVIILHLRFYRGIIPPNYSLTGECLDGYKGILCTDCFPGYSRSSSFECKKCPNQTENLVKIVGILLIFIIALIFMIRSTLNGASQKRIITSVFQKILLNHFQLVVLTSSFDFKWPESVSGFFKINEPIGEATGQIFSIDCLATDYLKMNSEPEKQTFRIFYMKLLMFALMPIVLASASYLVWWIIGWKDRTKMFKTKAISTIVILLFFVHPNIVKQVFQTFL